jgi:ArsR family transcriptional regulator, arsenate/arsenite/antimonite-responsive transcriptional repressor
MDMQTAAIPDVARLAVMLAAMGAESRLRIMRLLLSAHPEGLVVGDVQEETGIAGATLSHHLERLRTAGLVKVQREGTFLRYTSNVDALQEVLTFLYAECCSRNKLIRPQTITQLCKC